MGKKLIEIFDSKARILSERKTKDGDSMNVLVNFGQVDLEYPGTKRIYPKALMQREISRVQKDIEAGGFLGTADHPASGLAEVDNISHIVQKAWLDSAGKGWAEMRILPTTKGKNLQTIIREGGRLGVSTRGYGTTDEKTRIVNNDYKLMGIDIVSSPSYKAGVFDKNSVFESIDFEAEDETIIEKKTVIEEIKRVAEITASMYRMLETFWEQDKSFSGTFEDYKALYEPTARKMMGIEKEEKDRLSELKKTMPMKKVEPRDVFIESRLLGCTASSLAKKINEGIDFEAQKAGETEEDRIILKDAKYAGLDTSTPEARKQILEDWKKNDEAILLNEKSKRQAKVRAIAEQLDTKASLEEVEVLLKKVEEDNEAEAERVAELSRIHIQKRLAGANKPSSLKS